MRVGLSLAVFFLASWSDLGAGAESSLLAPDVRRVQALTPNASGRLLRRGKLSVKAIFLQKRRAHRAGMSSVCWEVAVTASFRGCRGRVWLRGRGVRSPSHVCRCFSEGVTGGGPAHHR